MLLVVLCFGDVCRFSSSTFALFTLTWGSSARCLYCLGERGRFHRPGGSGNWKGRRLASWPVLGWTGYRMFRRFFDSAHLPQSVQNQSSPSRSLHFFPNLAPPSSSLRRDTRILRRNAPFSPVALKYFSYHFELPQMWRHAGFAHFRDFFSEVQSLCPTMIFSYLCMCQSEQDRNSLLSFLLGLAHYWWNG